MAARLMGGAGKPKPSAGNAPTGKNAPEVLSKETGKSAAKEGVKQGLKGAAKGLATGGLHGAAAGAVAGAASGAADKVNEASDARKQAGQHSGPRNNGGLLASSGALDKGRAALENKYGGALAAKTANSKVPLTKEQAVSIGKASLTINTEVSKAAAKKAGIAFGTVLAIAYGLVMTTVSATTAPLAATVSASNAGTAVCEDPNADTTTATPGDKGTEDGLKPAALKAQRYINSQWGGKIADIYGVRQGANALDHAEGNALDVMLADYKSEKSNALGWEIAKFFQANAKQYGITYIIFDSKIWANGLTPDSSWTYSGNGQNYGAKDWAPYRILPGVTDNDTQQHLDHVHISFKSNVDPEVSLAAYRAMDHSDHAHGMESHELHSEDTHDLKHAAPVLEMERASSISVFNRLPVLTANLSDLNSSPTQYGLVGDPATRKKQIDNAKTIIGMAKTIGFNQEGAVIGIMTAMTESDLINVDYGDDAINPDGQMNTSAGLFQQQPSTGWGSAAQVRNPVYAAQAFYLGVNGNKNPGLQTLGDWKTMDPWMAAQKVQRSGFPDGSNYKSKHAFAKEIVAALYSSSPTVSVIGTGPVNKPDGSVNTDTSTDGCAQTVGDGSTGAVAKGDTYPARNESYSRTEAGYAVQCADSVAGGCRGECVDWAAWKLIEYTGTYGTHRVFPLGNGGDWGASASAKGIKVDMNPVAGDAIFWLPGLGGSGSAGHIGTVQAVNGDGTVTIEEYNFGGDTPATGGGRYHTRTIPVNDASGYIHFIDPSKSKEENKQNLIDKGILVPGKGTWPRSS
jgi:surface antigen